MSPDEFPKWDYKEYPKTLSPNDLWGQVRRTVFGKPVPEDQIQMMVDAILGGLKLQPNSTLLDIGCGNGALTERLFPYLEACLGVDSSEYLVSVAQARFASSRHIFICKDAVQYVAEEADPTRFDKALCFGVFAYLSDIEAQELLSCLRQRFLNVRSLFIGSIPDPHRAGEFFKNLDLHDIELSNPQSQIGVWRSHDGLLSMAEGTGWQIRFPEMSPGFYQSHYRYNAVLERPV